MRPFKSTISIDEARRLLREGVRPIDRVETVALFEAEGRVASADVQSRIEVPPFARSAMDGYAVTSRDLAAAGSDRPVRLRIVDRIYTGQVPRTKVEAGAAIEIATGAPLPDGADAVVMVEETRRAGDSEVEVLAPVTAGQNIGRRGADISSGDLVVRFGDHLNASRIGALAAIGSTSVQVFARPRVAVLSTGNEVIDPGERLAGAQIFDVNRFTLGAVVNMHGGIAVPRPPVPDTMDAHIAALDQCSSADILIFSGGSSVGDRDLIVDLVAARGSMVFHGIAVKPGKPTAFALVDGKPFFGMPGNPTSCLSNAYILLVPFLRATARLPLYAPRTIRLPLGAGIVSQAGRHQFFTVRMRDGMAYPAFKGSGEITSLSQADGYIEIPADQSRVEEGSEVTVTLF